MNINLLIALYVVIDGLMLLAYITLSIIFLVSKEVRRWHSYYSYVIWNTGNGFSVLSVFFIFINAVAFISFLVALVYQVLN